MKIYTSKEIDNLTSGQILTEKGSYKDNALFLNSQNMQFISCIENNSCVKIVMQDQALQKHLFVYDKKRQYLIKYPACKQNKK